VNVARRFFLSRGSSDPRITEALTKVIESGVDPRVAGIIRSLKRGDGAGVDDGEAGSRGSSDPRITEASLGFRLPRWIGPCRGVVRSPNLWSLNELLDLLPLCRLSIRRGVHVSGCWLLQVSGGYLQYPIPAKPSDEGLCETRNCVNPAGYVKYRMIRLLGG